MSPGRDMGVNSRITCIVGARPNFIKIAPLIKEFRRRPQKTVTLIHTGQHYSPEMSDSFFRELNIPAPDLNLGAGAGTQAEQTAEIMKRLDPVLASNPPDLVLVVGDVNSTLAAALVAAKRGIRIAHVEAGLRSFDRTMPEEINRVLTDVISDYLFATERSGVRNLLTEGIPPDRIFLVGNVMIDTLLDSRNRARKSGILERLQVWPGEYALATLHRPSNVDDVQLLGELVETLADLARRIPVVFPVHPRTHRRIAEANLSLDGLILSPPLGYLDFLRLMDDARLVLTDSGGIQEETTVLGVPCLTLRENTERPVTIEQGSNRLVGRERQTILRAAAEAMLGGREPRMPELWDGKASVRIADILEGRTVEHAVEGQPLSAGRRNGCGTQES